MRERRFLVDPEEIREGRASIRGEELRHLRKVLRLRAGDPVAVFDGRGRGFQARLETIGADRAVALLGDPEPADVEPALRLTVMASLLHGDRMEGIVEKVTEIGAHRIVPVLAARGVVRPSGRGWGRLARLRRIAVAAAKQSGRLVVPGVSEPIGFEEAIGWEAPEGAATLRFILDASGRPAATIAQGPPAPEAAILVGPEGGWTEEESGRAAQAGWRCLSLGPTTLRADTAAVAGAALVMNLALFRSSPVRG